MNVERIHQSEYETLQAWCRGHGKGEFPEGWLPPVGYWVPGVLAAFLFRTDSKVAYLECVISNPESTRDERREAMHLVADAIRAHARRDGYWFLLGLTAIPTVAEESKRFGFTVSKPRYSHLVMRIGGEK